MVTRTYVTLAALTTIATTLDIVSPLHLYLNTTTIVHKVRAAAPMGDDRCSGPTADRRPPLPQYEFHRLFTNFLFFGTLGLDSAFNLYILYRYSEYLESSPKVGWCWCC